MAMEAPPPSTTSIRLDSAVKIEPNEVEMDIEIDDDILDYFPVSDSNGITVSGFTIFDAFKKLLREIKTMKEQLASFLENQSVASQAIEKCSALEEQLKAIKEDLDGHHSMTEDQRQNGKVSVIESQQRVADRPMVGVKVEHGHQQYNGKGKRNQSQECAGENSSRRTDKAGQGHNSPHATNSGGKQGKKCGFCGKRFAYLGRHMKSHTGEKPYRCSVCDRAFIRADDLKTHERIHTGERPYKCSVCQRAFSLAGSLRKNERIHTGERPFKCQHCDLSIHDIFKQTFTEEFTPTEIYNARARNLRLRLPDKAIKLKKHERSQD